MRIRTLLRHQWRRHWRSGPWGRSLVATGLFVGAAVYVGALLVGLGWAYPEIVAQVAPQRDPRTLLHRHLLSALAGLTAARFVWQRAPGSAVRPYRPLPVRTGALVRGLQAASALSLLNLLPLLFLAALWASTVLPAAPPTGAAVWGVGVLLAVACTEFVNTLLRVAWAERPGLVVGAGALLVAGGAAGPVLGAEGLRAASGWLFGGLVDGRGGPLALLVLVAAGAAWAAHWALRARLPALLDGTARPARGGPARRARRWSARPVVSLALLNATLIRRNRRPRQLLIAGLLVLAPLAYVLGTGEALTAVNTILFSLLLTGNLGLSYGQFGYAWHGGHFDGLLRQPHAPRRLVQAHFLVFAGLCAGTGAVMGPVLGALRPALLGPLAALLLYNIGVMGPLLLGIGVWARTAMHLDESTIFNYQGVSARHVVLVLPVLGGPLGVLAWLGGEATLWGVAGVGALGLGTAPLWTRALGRLLRRHRHAMAAGFRETEG